MKRQKKTEDGFTLFVAITVASLLLLISLAISNIALKETILSSTGRESQIAFFAANSGIECALYWDQKIGSVFVAPGYNQLQTTLECAGATSDDVTPTLKIDENGDEYNEYLFGFEVSNLCVNVIITKKERLLGNSKVIDTRIESRGYNRACAISGPSKLERAIRTQYSSYVSSQ